MGIKDSFLFTRFAKKAFKEIDVDKTGRVDYKEVCIGVLKVYDSLNAKFPAHVLAPKRAEIWGLCRKYDKNGDGTIDFDEFLEMAKVLVGSRKNFRESLTWKYGSVMFLKLVICPLIAVYFIKVLAAMEVPGHAKLPAAALAAAFEMVIKFATAKLEL